MSELMAMSIEDAGRIPATDRDGFARIRVEPAQWIALSRGCAQALQDLSALWIDGNLARMALIGRDRSRRCIATLELADGTYPSVAQFHAPAIRLERAMHDLYRVTPVGLPDLRPWLDHGVWPASPEGDSAAWRQSRIDYAFLPADGEGLHQVPVGPVHAGIIEPGHFRITANGEAVVRLEERFGYLHKGIEALCVGKTVDQTARIVARISGDSTVAYSLAFARSIEAAAGIEVPVRAVIIRAVMAELERIAHHINDFGAICNDASVVAIHAHCTLLRENILATCDACFGHRMMMDRIVPGGVSVDLTSESIARLRHLLDACELGRKQAVRIYDGMPSVLDRTVTTGRVSNELAERFAAGGFVGRASGRDFDCRRDACYAPYDTVAFDVPIRSEGDVDARAWIRLEEIVQSISIIRQLLDRLPDGPVRCGLPVLTAAEGAAFAEAFRGDVFLTVRLDSDGRIAHCHARDASWFQWPLVEAAIEGNIVADFPLCNKSFNCSYAGHDI